MENVELVQGCEGRSPVRWLCCFSYQSECIPLLLRSQGKVACQHTSCVRMFFFFWSLKVLAIVDVIVLHYFLSINVFLLSFWWFYYFPAFLTLPDLHFICIITLKTSSMLCYPLVLCFFSPSLLSCSIIISVCVGYYVLHGYMVIKLSQLLSTYLR